MSLNNCSVYCFLFFRPLTWPGQPFHKKIIASKMEDSKRQLCTPERISNYPDDLESDFDTSSSSDDTDFESKFFFSFRTISWELKADTSWFVSNLPIKVDVFCRSLVPSSFDFYRCC